MSIGLVWCDENVLKLNTVDGLNKFVNILKNSTH